MLEKVYKSFREDCIGEDELKRLVLEYAYKQVEKDRYIEAGDFILRLIPKIDDIIKRYNSDYASFKHYINSHIKWLMFSFSKEYKKYKEQKEAFVLHNTKEYQENLSLAEEKPEYSISPMAARLLSIKNGSIEKKSSRSRLEIFTLKNSRNLELEQIAILAPLIGRSETWLFEKSEYLKSICKKRIENREYLQKRYNRLFMEITKDQQRLTELDSGYEYDSLMQTLQDKQRRKSDLLEQIRNRNCGPKNEEIAKLLNIPKGTVDSSLYYMKKSLQRLLKEEKLD